MSDIDIGLLEYGLHATLISDIATRCVRDESILAIWVGGSLATGSGDAFSDVDFRIAVAPGSVRDWAHPDWSLYLPALPCGELVMPFGETALLHHLILEDGTIVDFYVQDTTVRNARFDEIVACIKARGIVYGSGPFNARDGEINHRRGGRGLYFVEPSGHMLEIMTVPETTS